MNISGSIPALITPFLENGDIDYQTLEKLIEWHLEQGSSGLVVVGTTGESATLSVNEHRSVIRYAMEVTRQRFPIIAGTGANSTAEAIELTEHAKQANVDACLLVVPYYNKPEQDGLLAHFTKIADSVNIPQILYNVPGRTACDLLPETVAQLAKHPNIIGIKDATGDLQRLSDIQALVDEDFILLTGDDSTACDFILQGGHGGITVTGNVAPKLNAELYQQSIEKNVEQAKKIDVQLQGLHKQLFCSANPIPVKWAMSRLGFGHNTLRLPLTPLLPEKIHLVEEAMKQAAVI